MRQLSEGPQSQVLLAVLDCLDVAHVDLQALGERRLGQAVALPQLSHPRPHVGLEPLPLTPLSRCLAAPGALRFEGFGHALVSRASNLEYT